MTSNIFQFGFGGEPIESRDGESLEGVGIQHYYPFGETRLTTGTIYTDKLFTGQREITGLSIYHYGARQPGAHLPRAQVPGSAGVRVDGTLYGE